MARIELRDATIRLKDGLSGTALINEPTTAPVATDTEFDIDTVSLNTTDTQLVPVGARFTLTGETTPVPHTVTGRTPASSSPTTNIVFTPALGAGTYLDGDTVTFINQQIDVKVGDGNLTYTENKEYEYELDRGNLDAVREGDEQPMDVTLDFVYEFVTTGTGETVTPVDALKGKGGAAEWVSSSADLCEPYAVDIEVFHEPPCGTAQDETTIFPDYRYDTLEFDLDDASISATGRCNATEPTITRS